MSLPVSILFATGVYRHHIDVNLSLGFLRQNQHIHNVWQPQSSGTITPFATFSLVSYSACFPLMALGQNTQLVGKGQEIAQNPQMILGVWGWQSGRKARTWLLEPDGLGSDPSSVPHQLHDFGWAPETHWVSVSSSAEFLYLLFS